jgi:hypothetical protein
MQPKLTNTLLFYSRFATIVLLLAVNPNFAWAKAPCISKSNAGNSCVLEQSQGFKSQNISQDSDALAIDHLYYSGGILHNKVLAGETTPIKGLQQPVDTAEKLARKAEIAKNLNKGASSVSIYSRSHRIFQNLNEAGRKSIQKCLRFGTYDAKLDGIWGEQTRNAISNFKSTASRPREKDKPSLFLTIKNIFSRKAGCHTLLTNIFG